MGPPTFKEEIFEHADVGLLNLAGHKVCETDKSGLEERDHRLRSEVSLKSIYKEEGTGRVLVD